MSNLNILLKSNELTYERKIKFTFDYINNEINEQNSKSLKQLLTFSFYATVSTWIFPIVSLI